ncbi:MAG: ABC transporter ATP-binding protein [Planctomycetes bacterium]|nr:ABC transporter ATP-binding protein [Planctomycetota bacterium]
MIELRDARKVYEQGGREVVALDGVSLTVGDGEFLAVIGRSGSGKSTLLHLAGGVDLPSSGSVRVDGKLTSERTDDELTLLRRRRIGFVFQFFNLLPTLTVLENVAMPLLLDGARASVAEKPALALLERVGLGHRAQHRPAELSGGEMQRTAIARALVMRPVIVLADEPTGNLDSQTGMGVLKLLRELTSERRCTVVMVTHDRIAAATADRTVELADGRLLTNS